MRILKSVLVIVLLTTAGFLGCTGQPTGPNSDSDTTSVDHNPASIILVDSWVDDKGARNYELKINGLFNPVVEDSAALLGFKADNADWKNWRLGVIGQKEADGGFTFVVKTGAADKRINFLHKANWAQIDSLKKTGYFEASADGGNLAIHFENGKISKVKSSSTVENGQDTSIAKTDTVILGEMIKIVGEPIPMGNGYWRNTILFSARLVRLIPGGVPFVIGLPTWSEDSIRSLGAKRADGYYPLVVTMKDGRYPFGFGGDYDDSWADEGYLAQTYWGKKTSKGEICELVQRNGHIFPGSLVDTSTGALVVVHDTVIHCDTIQGAIIIDTLFMMNVGVGKIDTVITHDTISINTVQIKIVRDTIKIPGKVVVDTLIMIRDGAGRIDTVFKHDTISIKTDTGHVILTVIEKGTVIDSVKDFLRDTSWLDSNELKGVITLDTIVRNLSIRNYAIVSAKGDTTPKADTSITSTKIYRYTSDTISLVIKNINTQIVGQDFVCRFGITEKVFSYMSKNDTSASLIGLDTAKWKFIDKIDGYFVFDATLASGTTYSLNFQSNNGTWAKQEILLLDPRAVKNGANCDIVVKGAAAGLVKP